MLAAVAVVAMMSMAKGQDVSDCAWHPDPDQAILQCNLKTLQTGPAVIPQVNYLELYSIKKSRKNGIGEKLHMMKEYVKACQRLGCKIF